MLIDNYDETKIDEAIDRLLTAMAAAETTSNEYATMADHLTKLIKNKQIITELKLKSLDASNKKETDTANLEHKSLELKFKDREHDNNIEFKSRELDLKNRELDVREADAQDTFALRKRELDMKKSEAEKPDRISKETWAAIGANLAGIVLILGHERANVIASKALGFVLKSR